MCYILKERSDSVKTFSRANSSTKQTDNVTNETTSEFLNSCTNEDNRLLKNELIQSLISSKKHIRTLNSGRNINIANTTKACLIPVSYTHLTLPTILRV